MAERKHILFLSNHLRGPKGSAGARSWHQTAQLAQSFDVTVVIPAIDPVTTQVVTPETYQGLPDRGVEVVKVAVGKNDRSSLLGRARYYFSLMPRQILTGMKTGHVDLILCMSLPVTSLAIAWFLSLWHRCPLVVDVRDMPFDTAREIGFIRNKGFIAALIMLESFFLRRAEAILTNSPRYKEQLAKRGIHENRITVALIGYDGFEIPSGSEIAEWRHRMVEALGPDVRLIGLFAGTMGVALPIEGLLENIASVKDVKEIGFVFLGDGQKLEDYRRLVEASKARVWFAGRVSKHDVAAACRAADFCLYPAEKGTFSGALLGNKVFDYIGNGKAVLYLGYDSAVRDLILELGAGLAIEPKQQAQFREVLLDFLAKPEALDTMTISPDALEKLGLTASASAAQLVGIISHILSEPASL